MRVWYFVAGHFVRDNNLVAMTPFNAEGYLDHKIQSIEDVRLLEDQLLKKVPKEEGHTDVIVISSYTYLRTEMSEIERSRQGDEF